MIRYDVENRMVVGDYERDALPDLIHVCPSCKSEWDYYFDEPSDNGAWYCGTRRVKEMPFNQRVCARCAAYARSNDSMLRFVEQSGLEAEIIRYGFPQMTRGQREKDLKAFYVTMRACNPAMIARVIDIYIEEKGAKDYTWWAIDNA